MDSAMVHKIIKARQYAEEPERIHITGLDVRMVPVERLDLVQRYSSAEGHEPTLDRLEIEVRNTLVPKAGTDLAGSNGIGLVNTRRRLDLLYPGRYALHVTERTPDNEFDVQLALQVGA